MSRTPVTLVLRALGLGDLLTAVPALRGLRRALADHRIVLAAPETLAPLARATGAVDDVLDTPGLVPLHGRVGHVDTGVNLHGRGPKSHIVLRSARPARTLAFSHPRLPWTDGGPLWREDEHEVARWCRLVAHAGMESDPSDLAVAPPGGPDVRYRGMTVIHPGAAHAARRWPAERWAAVARQEIAAGHRVVITGGPTEVALARTVAQQACLPEEVVVAGRTSLLELHRLVAAAGCVLSADTGVAHLATATGTPSVVLFGPVAPAQWGPPPDRPWHRTIWKGRRGDPRADRVDPGLLAITVDEVVAARRTLARPEALGA